MLSLCDRNLFHVPIHTHPPPPHTHTHPTYPQVTVALIDLAPEFHYISVPRLSPHSFLQAKAKNTSPYTMLAGPANIFLDNNFIAKVGHDSTDIDPERLQSRLVLFVFSEITSSQ